MRCKPLFELRDFTRRRKKLMGNLTAEKNRIQKVLEAANVKIGNIVSDVFGVSGQSMLKVLLSREEIAIEQIADLSKRRLRQRIPELIEALQGHSMNKHHRWLIEQSVEHAVLLDRQIEELEARIEKKLEPFQTSYELLQTIPGVKEMTASILAETGGDMKQFDSAKHLCSWAGICSGNNRSAGKSKHSRIKKGNKFLLAALVQAGWAAARKRDSLFQRKFHRWMRRLGEAKANVAIAHALREVVYAMLRDGRPYQEPDPQQMHAVEKAKLVQHHTKRLRQLGAEETLVAQIVSQLAAPATCAPTSEAQVATQPARLRKACPAKPCRGALGFRARQTRKQEYSVINHPAADTTSRSRPKVQSKPKPKAKPTTNTETVQ